MSRRAWWGAGGTGRGRTALVAALAALPACDTAGQGAPAPSRVQAVIAEPGQAPAAVPSAVGATAITPAAEPAPRPPEAPRPPLCASQIEAKPQRFKPKRVPTRFSVDPGRELPPDPLKRSRGHWTWVNFWAAWCVPCREELPLLFRWRESLAEHIDFEFVSLDDDERQLREFLERQPADGLRQSYWLPDGAVRLAWLEALGLTSEPQLPLQLLIDPKGMLRCRIEGAVDARDLEALERIVRN